MPVEDELLGDELTSEDVETPEIPEAPAQPTIDPAEFARIKAEREQLAREKQERDAAEQQRRDQETQARTAKLMEEEDFQKYYKQEYELKVLEAQAMNAFNESEAAGNAAFAKFVAAKRKLDNEKAEDLIQRNMRALGEMVARQNAVTSGAQQFAQGIKSDPRYAPLHTKADVLAELEQKIVMGTVTRQDLVDAGLKIAQAGGGNPGAGNANLRVLQGGGNPILEGMNDANSDATTTEADFNKAAKRLVKRIMAS